MARLTIVIIMTTALGAATVWADSTAVIYGKVLDAKDGQPVVGARVVISGTNMGTIVNLMDGTYVITNILPGKYSVVASCIGYNKGIADSLLINPRDSLALSFALRSESVNMGIINLVDRPPLINKYETNLKIQIQKHEIERLPVTDLKGILKYNAGIIDKNGSLHIRGSRAGEVGIIDDGVFIRDELGGH